MAVERSYRTRRFLHLRTQGWDDVIPRSSFLHVLALDVESLGSNISLLSYLDGPKSHLLSLSEEVSKVSSV